MRLDLADTEKAGDDVGTVGWHLMATTRMADDPKHGVVDVNLRVHGTDNLDVASSSVFPTVGYSNPTLDHRRTDLSRLAGPPHRPSSDDQRITSTAPFLLVHRGVRFVVGLAACAQAARRDRKSTSARSDTPWPTARSIEQIGKLAVKLARDR